MSPKCLAVAVLLAVCVPSNPVAGMVWTTQNVDSGGGEFASLALDLAGNPHMTYQSAQGDHYLCYAAYDGTSWSTETIEPGGRRTSLAIDSNGVEHISHSTDSLAPPYTTVLRYVTRAAGSWQGEDVGPGGSTSIALDAAGHPCIAHGYSEVGLRYSVWHGASWSTQSVDLDGTDDISLALTDDDRPCIAYRSRFGANLKYANWVGDVSGWSFRTLDTSSVSDPSLALDSNGYPHIAYYCGVVSDLKYAYWDGSDWQFTTVAAEGVTGSSPSLVLDDNDNPHIAYWDDAGDRPNTLAYASFDGSSWAYETVALQEGPPQYGISLALGENGAVHIAYGESWALKYAYGVPEPATLSLLVLGGALALRCGRRRGARRSA